MQTIKIEYNQLPTLTYNPPKIERPIEPMQKIENNRVLLLTNNLPTAQRSLADTWNNLIEYNHFQTLTYNPTTHHIPLVQMQTNIQVPTGTYELQTAQRSIEQIQTGEVGYNQVPSLTFIQPITQRPMHTHKIYQLKLTKYQYVTN